MSSYTYVDTPNPNLVCCVCRSPFVDPCTTRTCCHTFCYECIARAITISHQCPIDRCPLTLHDLASADPLIRNLVDEMIVECPHREAGCTYTCQRLLLAAHLNDSCEFVEVTCSHEGCDEPILRKNATAHTHTTPENSDAALHTVASDVIQAPPTAESSEASSSPATVAGVPNDPLASENALLRLRISALEGVVNVLRQEMQAVQRALGPWYRAEDASLANIDQNEASRPADLTTPTEAPPILNASTSLPLSPSRSAGQRDIRPSPTQESSAGLDLSSYFPPAEEEEEEEVYSSEFLQSSSQSNSSSHSRRHSMGPPVSSRSQRGHQTPSHGQPMNSHTQSTYPNAYASTPPFNPTGYTAGPSPFSPLIPYAGPPAAFSPPPISVPPLDPTTPLPTTLASLHGTMVSLAGALGALASTRAQDTLYTGEELRSVKAGMHGLRMQLHDVMTARPSSTKFNPSSVPAGPLGGGSASTESSGLGSMGIGGEPSWLLYGQRAYDPLPSRPTPMSTKFHPPMFPYTQSSTKL